MGARRLRSDLFGFVAAGPAVTPTPRVFGIQSARVMSPRGTRSKNHQENQGFLDDGLEAPIRG